MTLPVPKIWRFRIIPGRLVEKFRDKEKPERKSSSRAYLSTTRAQHGHLGDRNSAITFKNHAGGSYSSEHILSSVPRYATLSQLRSSSDRYWKPRVKTHSRSFPFPSINKATSSSRFSPFPNIDGSSHKVDTIPDTEGPNDLGICGESVRAFPFRSSLCTILYTRLYRS